MLNLDFTEEQDMLREMVRGLLGQYASNEQIRALEDDPVGYSTDLWTQLRELDLEDTEVTDKGLERLKELSRLERLEVSAAITDTGLEQLRGLSQLKWLDLSNTSVTDAGREQLRGLDRLETLDLSYTLITDAGLMHL